MAVSGISVKNELESAINRFNQYPDPIRQYYDQIIRAENKDTLLAGLPANESEKIRTYEKLVRQIDSLIYQRIRNTKLLNMPTEALLMPTNKPVTFRAQMSDDKADCSHSLDASSEDEADRSQAFRAKK